MVKCGTINIVDVGGNTIEYKPFYQSWQKSV